MQPNLIFPQDLIFPFHSIPIISSAETFAGIEQNLERSVKLTEDEQEPEIDKIPVSTYRNQSTQTDITNIRNRLIMIPQLSGRDKPQEKENIPQPHPVVLRKGPN